MYKLEPMEGLLLRHGRPDAIRERTGSVGTDRTVVVARCESDITTLDELQRTILVIDPSFDRTAPMIAPRTGPAKQSNRSVARNAGRKLGITLEATQRPLVMSERRDRY